VKFIEQSFNEVDKLIFFIGVSDHPLLFTLLFLKLVPLHYFFYINFFVGDAKSILQFILSIDLRVSESTGINY
jgi:cellulose synthase/poly-beta-1,6-N-acetylglucosamine synthase-like glycosyltransferase